MIGPCMDHRPEPGNWVRGPDHTLFAFERAHKELFAVIDGELYVGVGQHSAEGRTAKFCLRNVMTGVRVDIDGWHFRERVAPGGPWKLLTEMEVVAWAAK